MTDAFYQDDQLTLLHGDARDILASMPDRSVDCIVTSPPYYGLRDYEGGSREIGHEITPSEYVSRLAGVFHEARRILKDDGTLWVNIGDSYAGKIHPAHGGTSALGGRAVQHRQGCADDGRTFDRPRKNLLGIPWRLAFAMQDDGWLLRSDIVWHKPNAMPESVSDRPTKSWEHIFLFAKSERYWYDASAVRQPQSEATIQDLKHRHTFDNKGTNGGTRTDLARDRRDYIPADGKRNMRDVWTIPTRPYPGAHFATYPIDLPLRCIQAGCRPGGVVLDPFSGSGTTGLAAAQLGHPYVGIDLNEEYLKLSLRTRLAQACLITPEEQ